MNRQLKQDYKYCENIIKKHSKTFYYAFSGLPKKKARAVYAVYAFCRMVDDSVDEVNHPADQEEALKRFMNELKDFENGQESDTPIWRALRDVFNRYDMNIDPFYLQIEGQRLDIIFKQPETLKELEEYSYLVAGSVGLMLLPIIASKNHKKLHAEAVSLGIAMQITNVLRDIGEDWKQRNRIYLPKDRMKVYEYGEEHLEGEDLSQNFIDLWEELAQVSERYYDQFTQHIHAFDADCQKQVLLSANAYREILNAVRKNEYDCLTERNYVSKSQMDAVLASTKNTLKNLSI